jgi:hypothetical protein
MAKKRFTGLRYIHRWSGQYFGFLLDGYLFNRQGEYVGWATDEGAVWLRDGRFLGELVEDNYILRRNAMMEPSRRIPKIQPIRPIPPIPALPRIPRISRLGWSDSLGALEDA